MSELSSHQHYPDSGCIRVSAPSAVPTVPGRFPVFVTSGSRTPAYDTITVILRRHLGAMGSVVIVTDRRVADLYAENIATTLASDGLRVRYHILPDGEDAKDFSNVAPLLESIVAGSPRKPVSVLAIGGGSVCNLATLACALAGARAELLLVATTNMAQADLVVGSKGLANLRSRKNAVRAYLNPKCGIVDIGFLSTLHPQYLKSGLVESVKHALVDDPSVVLKWRHTPPEDLPSEALREIVLFTIHSKIRLLEKFFRARGIQPPFDPAGLQYGHLIGHAVESLLLGEITHGQAVLWGMLVASEAAAAASIISPSCRSLHWDFYRWLDLDVSLAAAVPTELIESMLWDLSARCGSQEYSDVLLADVGRYPKDADSLGRTSMPIDLIYGVWQTLSREIAARKEEPRLS